MKINARLKKIGDLVEANSFCLDVGCDHAYLDIYLTQNNDNKCIATDINKKYTCQKEYRYCAQYKCC